MKNLMIKRAVMLFFVSVVLTACSFFASINDSDDDDNKIEITSLSLGKSELSLSVGAMSYVSVSIKPTDQQKNVKLTWNYDGEIIKCDTSSSWGVTITGLKEGQTNLKCSYGGYEATCIITISGYAENYEETVEPYIYSSTSILQTAPGVTEKVYVSLYGGSAADIDGYTWTSDNASVCSIESTGQYCLISAKDTGYARIKVTHTKATYPYYIGVYVFDDATKVSYITTQNNVLTMNLADDEQTISVSLVNGKDTSSDSSFVWSVVNDTADCPIGYETNGNKAVITPLKAGSCTLRVTHPDATYPLDILCRVISVVKNVYIEPDNTVLTLSGEMEQTVTSTLKNLDSGEYDIDAYSYALDDYNVAEIIGYVGNQVMLKGKANGSCKLLISHEKAAYAREVLLIVNGQLTDAVDASCYITTSQNYIRTKVGADATSLLVSLKGGEDGDEAGFVWSVKSTPTDGTSDVILLETTNGTAIHSRAAAQTYAYGNAYITPKTEGTAVITVTHPKIVYPTEILVKVLNKDAILEEPLYFTGSGLLRILNGESADYTVQLKGTNKSASDDNGIKWSVDDNRLSVAGSGNVANVTAPVYGTGSTISHMTISHNKADADKSVLIMTADDEETLMSMKALYSDKLYYNFKVGSEATVMCSAVGFESDNEEAEEYDYSLFAWTVSDPTVISVEKNEYNPLVCTVKGLKSGTTRLTGSIVDSGTTYSCDFTITVYPVGAVQTEPEVYFTTTQNVVVLGGSGKTSSVSVSAINLKSSEYSNIVWSVDDGSVASVQPNGNKATITALCDEGETVVSVTHADSQNTLKIYVRIGSEYVIPDAEPVVYISAQDVITMLKDDSAQKLNAVLVNYGEADTSGFSFAIDNEEVATISSQSTNGIAYIKPVASGQAEVTISHSKSAYTKKVLVVVGNSSEELAGFTYLTTNSNVVAIGEGNTKSVSVSVKNSSEVVVDGFTWSSSDASIVDVTLSGASALLKGNSIGTAIITVTSKYCTYPLQIIAQVVDPIAASANPYIHLTSSVLTLNVSSTYSSITADLVGGTEDDFSNFVWTSSDSSVCVCYSQNEVGKIRALKTGTVYVTVSHPKAASPAQLLVVCDEVKESECYISVPSSIISMKPTDSAQTITASLINGSDTDKYNFTWSLDVYDVIDFVYSANVCTITPMQQGQATITVHHPKSSYDQQIIVTVQEYTTFAFPSDYTSITQGGVTFETMQVPNTKVATYVEYSVDNSAICSISGTKTTAQITAVSAGTTTVRAKLVASSTGVTQASAEMMVYVKEKEVNACYITATSTIYTVSKGKSQTLSATISGTGITASDQQQLKWTTNDTDVISVTGVSSNGTVTGQSIYITALKPGEALITCSHEKAASDLVFYVVVPGSAAKSITLNKSYITLIKGSSGTTLKATIENAESSNDYNELIWSVSSSGEDEVCRVMGSGQNVTIYPVNVGQAEVMVQHPDTESVAKCTVLVEAGKSFTFESTSVRVQPFHTKKIKYIVSPASANLTWTMNQADDYFTYNDLGCDEDGVGYVQVEGIKEGSGNLYCVTDGGAKGNLSVKVAWDYSFSLTGNTTFSITPVETKTVGFSVNPPNADIHVESTDLNSLFTYEISNNGDGTGSVLIKPITESTGNVSIKVYATNPNNGNEEVGSKVVTAKFQYSKLTPNVSFVSSDGNFSKLENEVLYIGDGENVSLKFSINEEKANGYVKSVSFSGGSSTNHFSDSDVGSDGIYRIGDTSDDTISRSYQYRINNLYVPYKVITEERGTGVYEEDDDGNQGDEIMETVVVGKSYVNWKSDLKWRCWYHTRRNGEVDDYMGLTLISNYTNSDPSSGKNWLGYYGEDTDTYYERSDLYQKEEDVSYRNTVISEYEFLRSPWLYCPGTISASKVDIDVTYDDIQNGTLSLGGYGKGHKVNISPRIMSQNVNATREEVISSDKSVVNVYQAGTLLIDIVHNGSEERSGVKIPVYYEVRNCPKNQE